MEKITIMIVDDDDTITGLIKMILGDDEKYRLYCFDNPRKALFDFSKKDPKIVITDFRMEDIDGLEMANEMRKIKPEIMVVFVSGLEEHAKICKENGFEHFLLKPTFMNPLIRIIKDLLNR